MVFLSYSWKDRGHAQKLASELKDRDLEVWVDYESLNTNSPLEPQIESAIENSVDIILVETGSSKNSRWVAFEIKKATSCDKKIHIFKPTTNPCSTCVNNRFMHIRSTVNNFMKSLKVLYIINSNYNTAEILIFFKGVKIFAF